MYRPALARTHRPRRFSELIGQDHVGSTLRAAIDGTRVGHAYLFSGPRGVGKTTAARILAMALNCSDRSAGEPCGSCESCTRIWSGQASLDVVEIDAASHRGVEDARDLRERAMYAPTSDERYKVYILDEAHMLTRDAWNALLKIIEEPPPRVIFVFATTEPQKIEQGAAPVLSRCQRFEFRRVSVPDIVSRLETVLELEGVAAEPDALLSIARRADGGVRDALSLLDQVLSFTGDQVAAHDVRRMLGLVEEDQYLAFFEIVDAGRRADVFPYVQSLLDEGYDAAEFVRGLADAIRMLLILRSDPDGAVLDILPETRERFGAMAARFAEADLLRLLLTVSEFETSGRFQRSSQARIQLEVLLLRLVSMDAAVELEELMRALGDRAGGSGPATPPVPESTAPPVPESAAPPVPAPPSVEPVSSPAAPTGPSEGGLPGSEPAEAVPARDPSPDHRARASLRDAWTGAITRTPDLGGQAVALRGARVEALRGHVLHLRVPKGLTDDLRAFFADGSRSASLRDALSRELGLDPASLAFEIGQIGGQKRLTAEEARRRKLSDMMEVDPHLREAVEELDLTIKE